MRICSQCSVCKPDGDYYAKGRKDSGKLMTECKACFNTRNMARYEDKARWLVEQKGGGCILCGYSTCTAALEFHHVEPEHKDFQINKRWSMSKENLLKEIDKCVLLCSNCHRETHWKLSRGHIVEFTGR